MIIKKKIGITVIMVLLSFPVFSQINGPFVATLGEEYAGVFGDEFAAEPSDADLEENNDPEILSDEQVIAKKFKKTLGKLGLYYAEVIKPSLAVTQAKAYLYTASGLAQTVRNPTWKNIKDNVVSEVLPEYSAQGTYLETVFDQELMRDIDQYVKYAEAFLDYGMLMTGSSEADTRARAALSPEKNITGSVEIEGISPPEELFGGLTASEYQENLSSAYTEVQAYEATDDEDADVLAIQGIIAKYFNDEQEQGNIIMLMGQLSDAEYTDDEDENAELVQTIYDDYYAMLDEQALEKEALEEEIAAEEKILSGEGNEWDNEVSAEMEAMGIGNRDVVSRYGSAAAEPYYSTNKQEMKQRRADAQKALTNVVNTWNYVEEARYVAMAVEMEALGRALLDGELKYDTGKIKKMYGEFKVLWSGIRQITRKNPKRKK